MTTLRDLALQVQGHLNQFTVNRPRTGTFVGFTGSGVTFADTGNISNQLVELETGELIHVTSHNEATGATKVPAWFRAQLGTPLSASVSANSRITVEPLWPLFHVAKQIADGAAALYPMLFAVKEAAAITTSMVNGNYELPADVAGILRVNIESVGPGKEQPAVWRWRLDTSNPDGKKYLRTQPTTPGRPLTVTYKAKPVALDPTNLAATWASTGLPESYARCAVLYAVAHLLPSADTSRLQTHSTEQSDRSRFVQAGSALAASRRYLDLFTAAVEQERSALLELYPPRPHREI